MSSYQQPTTQEMADKCRALLKPKLLKTWLRENADEVFHLDPCGCPVATYLRDHYLDAESFTIEVSQNFSTVLSALPWLSKKGVIINHPRWLRRSIAKLDRTPPTATGLGQHQRTGGQLLEHVEQYT